MSTVSTGPGRTADDCPPIVATLLESGVLSERHAQSLAGLDIDPKAMTVALSLSFEAVKALGLKRQQQHLAETVNELMQQHPDVPAGSPNQFQIQSLSESIRNECKRLTRDDECAAGGQMTVQG